MTTTTTASVTDTGRVDALVDRLFAEHDPADAPERNGFGMFLAAPTIAGHADDALMARLLRPLFTGEELWCQLLSEPGAGSDLAGLSTRAVRDGDEWVVDRQKVWNTLAHRADRGMLVARTNPDAPKHRGLTYFVLDMHAPDVDVRPLRQITGEAEFNEVYLTGVRVPDADRIGELGDGWRVSLTTLMSERVTIGSAVAGRNSGPIGDALKVWREHPERHDRVRRDRLARLWVDAEVLQLTNARAAANRKVGTPGSEGSVAKLAFAETQPAHLRAVHGRARRRGAALPRLRHGAPRRGEPHRRRRPAQDVPPVAGLLDRGRDVGDPAQRPG